MKPFWVRSALGLSLFVGLPQLFGGAPIRGTITFGLAGLLLLLAEGSAWRHVLWGVAVFVGLLALVVIFGVALRW